MPFVAPWAESKEGITPAKRHRRLTLYLPRWGAHCVARAGGKLRGAETGPVDGASRAGCSSGTGFAAYWPTPAQKQNLRIWNRRVAAEAP